MKWNVYAHVSPSHKVYIGITSKNPKYRWRNGKGYDGCIKFHNAILKYGWDDIEHYIIASNLTKEEAILIETSLIKFYKKLNLSYNLTDGGEGGRLGYSIPLTTDWKNKLSKSHIGLKHSENTKLKMSNTRRGKHQTSDWIRKRSMKKQRQIMAMLNGIIREYSSIKEASAELNINCSNISAVCSGKRPTAGGYTFKYK